MLDLYVYWTDMDKLQKFIQVRKSILNSVKHLVGNESGRKALIKSDGIAILYATAKQVSLWSEFKYVHKELLTV